MTSYLFLCSDPEGKPVLSLNVGDKVSDENGKSFYPAITITSVNDEDACGVDERWANYLMERQEDGWTIIGDSWGDPFKHHGGDPKHLPPNWRNQ